MQRGLLLILAMAVLLSMQATASAQSELVLELRVNNTEHSVYNSAEHPFIASYLAGLLVGLAGGSGSQYVQEGTDWHVIGFERSLDEPVYLAFTQGDWQAIDQRMGDIESGDFMDYVSPSFAFGLGSYHPLTVALRYTGIDIEGGLTISKGIYKLVIENRGSSGGDGGSGDWADASSDRCMDITLQGGNGQLTNFPYLIDLPRDEDMLDSYWDLRFYDAGCNEGGSLLSHEFDFTGPGHALVWVEVPDLPAGGTTISVYYKNNTAVSSGEDPDGVWDSEYAGVWHMNSNLLDSTFNGNDGTNSGSSDTAGRVGRARDFDGNDDYIDCGSDNSLRITGQLAISAWIRIEDPEQFRYMRIASKKWQWDSNSGYELEYNPAQDCLTVLGGGSNYARANNVNLDTGWHQVVGVIDDTVGTLYVDGNDRTSDSTVGSLSGNNRALRVGKQSGDSDYFNGGIDEVRISGAPRTAGWIDLSYHVVADQDTHVDFGGEEIYLPVPKEIERPVVKIRNV